MSNKNAPNKRSKRAREEIFVSVGMMTRSKRRKLDEINVTQQQTNETNRMKNVCVVLKRLTYAEIENACRPTKVYERNIPTSVKGAKISTKIVGRRKSSKSTNVNLSSTVKSNENEVTGKEKTTDTHSSGILSCAKYVKSIENDDTPTLVKEANICTKTVGRKKTSQPMPVSSSSTHHQLIVKRPSTDREPVEHIPVIESSLTKIVGNKSKGSTDDTPLQISNTLTVAKPDFALNDIVWAKLKGYCHWPARIDKIIKTPSGSTMYEVVWFNDNRRSKMYKLQVFKFFENFEEFAKKFDDVIGLKTAAFEAMYIYRQNHFGK